MGAALCCAEASNHIYLINKLFLLAGDKEPRIGKRGDKDKGIPGSIMRSDDAMPSNMSYIDPSNSQVFGKLLITYYDTLNNLGEPIIELAE